jgi:acyl-coenzyme A thioesterase PaaI-like protein
MNQTRFLLDKLRKIPFGLTAFSKAICLKAPYFSSISPVFTRLEPGHGEARISNRRAVRNHIGTVHAIAMANLCEFVGGVTLEISLPDTHRWIPKGMNIQYRKKAETDLVARTSFTLDQWPDSGPFITRVEVFDTHGELVVDADIEMHVSKKKTK